MSRAEPVVDDHGGEVHDVVGIGFGPSNLALAIAMEESGTPELRALFLDRQPAFGWHRGMLLDDATMQVSFLKDLVTLRNPTSDFSFLAYLWEKDRLVDFINHKMFYPLRVEFHDYLEWAASRVSHLVRYDAEVVEVRPVSRGGVINLLDVMVRRGDDPERMECYRTRNLVFALGLEASMPPGIVGSPRVWHSSELLARVAELAEEEPASITVIGAGQSAAEVIAYLYTRFQRAEIRSVFTRYGYSRADDSPFANRIFDPAAVDEFFQASADVREQLTEYHRNTNYSVVDDDLIDELYRIFYRERVLGERRLHVMHATRLLGLRPEHDSVELHVESLPTGQQTRFRSDIVVFGTGYKPGDPSRLLGALAGECKRDEQGRLGVDRDYRITTAEHVTCGIYVQGPTEHSHGISSTLLSNTAVRAGEILRSCTRRGHVERRSGRPPSADGARGRPEGQS